MHPAGLICARSILEHNLREECSGGVYNLARFGKRGLSAPGKASLRAKLTGCDGVPVGTWRLREDLRVGLHFLDEQGFCLS
jgi:hypothetical protein